MDLVIPLGKGSLWQDNELRYACRSFQRYAPEVDRVVLVGERPAWVRDVVHLQVKDNAGTHNANMLTKLSAALDLEDLSDRFVWSNDDMYLLQAVDWDQLHHLATVTDRHTYFASCMKATRDHLHTLGVERVLDYEVHMPVVLNARMARRVLAGLPHLDIAFRTAYFNLVGAHSSAGEDVKLRGDQRPGPDWWCFSSHSQAPRNSGFTRWMEAMFPEPSRWER